MKTFIFTVIKDEQEYLDYWIKYHLDLGIDHLYIFEDIESDSHKGVCDKYESVTLSNVLDIFNDNASKSAIARNKMSGFGVQNTYIRMGLEYIKKTYNLDGWCFAIDADEFLTPQNGYTIKSTIDEFKDYDAFMIQWENHNASGRVEKPDYDKINVHDAFPNVCGNMELDSKLNYTSKVCYNLDTYERKHYSDVHNPGSCKFCRTDFSTDRKKAVYDKLYIRHYITKSFDEYVKKLTVRGMSHVGHRKIKDFFSYNPDMIDRKEELMKRANEFIEREQESPIAIIIPCYNQEKYVGDAIRSVRDQSFIHFQCVVVNDGSTDNSEKVILEAIGDDSRFRYIKQENKGVAAARNLGISKTKSKYIMCLDADDMIDRKYLITGLSYMEAHDDCALYHARATMISTENSERKKLYGFHYRYGFFLLQCTLFVTNIYRREDFEKTDGYDNTLDWMEDWEFLIRLLDGGKKVYASDEFLFIYRFHPDSRSTGGHKLKAQEMRQIIYDKNKEIYDRNGITSFPKGWKKDV